MLRGTDYMDCFVTGASIGDDSRSIYHYYINENIDTIHLHTNLYCAGFSAYVPVACDCEINACITAESILALHIDRDDVW